MLELQGLSYVYQDEQAGYLFDLTAVAGSIVGITGRSGAGKSTCLELIAGFLRPDDGTLKAEGKDILHLPPEQRPVTILFQKDNLFEHLSAQDNVALGINPSLRLNQNQWSVVGQAIAKVGLAHLAKQKAARLSGGEQQRIALARSLVRNKPVLLLDEPFSALDSETRAEMLLLVREIVTERNLTCLMVSHDPNDCSQVADHHVVLKDGRFHLGSEVQAEQRF
ncbi:MAG: ATP-binding cassette domain-containing protein [Rhodospirillaceae bacterium]|jgi:thiamine transport system ATP-binding protein|nr:ATP-binding cassette domain-containing protein [Rhodospirillaceae bacterium]MBT4690570.1 ATP-binding cassette domain-containing protein [Rhodospirillaceae bacterium]MBT5083869.1 ATP-binding cassette domain-containing protein [Rhodospirillaceae bacterium]MBT5526629.1 ATP-binding cassette domain-containing protein [Rhodospirillaceae bacterium]MBT5882373.1 ATP-binding cassette domain-containing protein [Rhodospirillaceae bacterium]